MKWFMDLKIKTKLLLSFLLMAFIAAIIGYIGYNGINNTITTQEILSSQMMPSINSICQLKSDINMIVATERGLLIKDYVGNTREEQYSNIETGWKLLNGNWKVYESLS